MMNQRKTNIEKKNTTPSTQFSKHCPTDNGTKKRNASNTTKLNFRTLDKHLIAMTKNQLVERKPDVINGKYAVLYKAQPNTISYMELSKLNEEFSNNIESILEETGNNPLMILDMIHQLNQLAFITIMEQIQKNKQKLNPSDVEYLEDVYLEINYQILTRHTE